MDTKIVRILCVVGFIVGALITIGGFRHLQETGQPPGRVVDFGAFLLVFGTAFFIFPDRVDDRRFGWIVVIIAALGIFLTEALLRSH